MMRPLLIAATCLMAALSGIAAATLVDPKEILRIVHVGAEVTPKTVLWLLACAMAFGITALTLERGSMARVFLPLLGNHERTKG